ncbi:MAG: AgmX/PglI C-terminal domain-containing protein [Sorangiineae bacterium]|nr:AgmX/PglI C-terminal domain-containing protein [Polyangiaceae bacterium]MEB2321579.1 AgmX/PglI C-terminal domain-containing protein [Sorangiineae bacterium]
MMQPPIQPQGSGAARPGQMTAVMRAVAATGPKVLRIGVVQAGRVVEERIIKQRGHVTVGPSEKNLFVVATAKLPANFRLFELVANDYCLNFLEGMTGRVALPTGVSDLAVLRGQARRTPQGTYQIRLTEDSRGKVVVGDTTFLFQFVAPPPVQPKPQLPVSVTRGSTSIDWTTTMIAAFSFLLHFLLVGAVYSDWLDPIVDDEVNLASLIETVQSLPPPPPIEQQKVEEVSDQGAEKAAKPEKAAGSANKQAGPAGAAGGKMSNAQAAALSGKLDQLEMATLGALASEGPATAGVLRNSEVATGALDQAAASGVGVGAGTGDLRLGSSGGAVRPGASGGGLSGIGTTGKTGGTEGTGTVAKVQGPKGNASVGGAAVSGGTVSNASRVVAGMRAGFRSCYNQGLAQNPDAQGSIRLTIRVGPGGEVQGVSASASGNLPPSVVGCVQSRASAAQFAPPEGGAAVVVVPVTFVKQ